jgi:hypothetical protein
MLKSPHGSFLLAGCRVKKPKAYFQCPCRHVYGIAEQMLGDVRRQIMPGVAKRNKPLPVVNKKTTGAFFCQLSAQNGGRVVAGEIKCAGRC